MCHLNLCIKKWGHRARLGENDLLFLWTAQLSQKTYQVPNERALLRALITQEMMRRKDAQCNWRESPQSVPWFRSSRKRHWNELTVKAWEKASQELGNGNMPTEWAKAFKKKKLLSYGRDCNDKVNFFISQQKKIILIICLLVLLAIIVAVLYAVLR